MLIGKSNVKHLGLILLDLEPDSTTEENISIRIYTYKYTIDRDEVVDFSKFQEKKWIEARQKLVEACREHGLELILVDE